MGIELLARSAVAYVNPALLADPDKEQNSLLYALRIRSNTSKAKSIGVKQISKLCCELFSEKFTTDDKKAVDDLTDWRNEELHSGGLPFEIHQPSEWLFPFYKACASLSECQGKSLDDLFGEQEAEHARFVLEENRDQIIKSVHELVEERKVSFSLLSSEARASAQSKAASMAAINSYRNQHICVCPACQSDAGITGIPIGEAKVTMEKGMVLVRQAISPTNLTCPACKLTLNGYAHLEVLGLAGRYTRTKYYSPEEFHALDDGLDEWPEPDPEAIFAYNNE